MIRPVFTEIILFVTPFALYAIFLLATRSGVLHHAVVANAACHWPRHRGSRPGARQLLFFAQFSGAPPGSTYVPAHMENGKFVPGTTK